MANKMLIDATHPEETRVVVLRGNRVEEFDFETAHRKQLRGNIYLAKVTRVEPSLQAAFVEYGGNRHGFLAFSEIHPDYYQIPVADRQALIDDDARAARDDNADEPRGRRGRHRDREHRRPSRRDEVVHSEELVAEGPAAEVPVGESAAAEPVSEPLVFEAAPEIIETAEPVTQLIGEAANPPVPAEITPSPEQASDVPQACAASHSPDAPHEDAVVATGEASEAEIHDDQVHEDAGAPQPASDLVADGNGNGHANGVEDEEEIVESVGGSDALEEVPDRAPRYRRQYKIQEVIKRRQVMLVQVVKEERGTKGAALTTYLSLAGRYCVLMPNTARGGGISRKITSAEDRRKLREIADELEVPEGMGVILRTAGAARTKAEVKRDFEYLLRQWELVRDLTLRSTAPMLVYEEGSLVKRSIRDLYSKDIEEVVVAGEDGYRDAKEFMRMLMPSHAKNVKLYSDTQPIFTRYGIESQLDAMFSPTVQLRSGGYVVINQTEALVSIDVNSGRSTREHHIEDTALKTNVEAAEEIARQLRLRDLAGLIVIDFIDMDEKRNNRQVERRLKDALRNDRARIQVGRISHFGLLEMSRQRIRTSVLESSTEKCAHCGGTGHVRSVSSVALQLLRSLEETLLKGATHNQIVRTRPDIALYVLNHKRAHLRGLEERFRITITVNADTEVGGQVGFTIDRGDQMMTIEQARAIVAQAEAPPHLISEDDEPSAPEAVEEADDAAMAADADEAAEPIEELSQPGPGDADREPGRGRRRRRRRGRGRSGEDREQGAPDMHGTAHDRAHSDDAAASRDVGHAEPDEAAPEMLPTEAGFAPPHAEHDDGHGNGNGDGDRRRRRRGRRGGRRNRRDREDQPFGDVVSEHGAQPEHGHEATPDRDHEPRPDWHQPQAEPQRGWMSTPAPGGGIAETPFAPRVEAAPAQPAPAREPPPPAATEPAPPRRRSTVREPAPVFGETAPVSPPMPAPRDEPLPAPIVSDVAEADEAAKPRRTGWWARRLLGGEKG